MIIIRSIAIAIIFTICSSCVHTQSDRECESYINSLSIASTPMHIDTVPGYTVVDVRYPNFVFYENADRTGRSMIVNALSSLQLSNRDDISIDISKDNQGRVLLLWYILNGGVLKSRGVGIFDVSKFQNICSHKEMN